MRKHNQSGFTVVELMIATSVFAVVLLICTSSIIYIGRLYYKGATSARTQEAARLVMEEVTQSIQFTGGSVSSGGSDPYFRCTGSTKYSYVLGKQLKTVNPTATQVAHVLVADPVDSCAAGVSPRDMNSLDPTSKELLGERMRLSKFDIARIGTSDLYAVTVRVVYGDDDVLDNVNDPQNTRCKSSREGTQFCAVFELNTTVQKRI